MAMSSSELEKQVLKQIKDGEALAVRQGWCCLFGLLKAHSRESNQALAKCWGLSQREIKALRLLYHEQIFPYTIECHKSSSPLPDEDLTCFSETPRRYFAKMPHV